MERLAGLWTGPATQTPLGDFALMNVDFRSVTDGTAFGRTDLDAENNLRFGFWIETHNGQDVWVYRNGGYFQGILRDTRTVLVSHDEQTATYRFCALSGGCDYVDALYDFDGPTALTFDVKVRNMQHVLWQASRVEERVLPVPFPADQNPLGGDEVDFPPMPSLNLQVSWQNPLTAVADVWVILTVANCNVQTGVCNPSRSIKVEAAVPVTTAAVTFEQIHAGAYKATVILDRNRNLSTSLQPDPQDGISIPNTPVTVPATGTGNAVVSLFVNP